MKHFGFSIALIFVIFSAFLFSLPVFAQTSTNSGDDGPSSKIIPKELLSRDPEVIKSQDNVNVFITLAINIGLYLFGFIGALALLFFIYGGILLIISQGNQEKIKQGTSAMTAAIVGLVISFSAYALVSFLSSTIGVKTEKRLNFINTVYATDALFCHLPADCYEISEENMASCPTEFIRNDPCEGTGCFNEFDECVEESIPDCRACDLSAPEFLPTGEFLQETPGEVKDDGKSDITALKRGAMKLNQMDIRDPTDLMSRAINLLIAFMGSIAVVLYIYAGFIWMSASGNAEKVSKAKNILIWTTLGALAMGGSYMIVTTILTKIG